MSRKEACYWTRKLELELVNFIRKKEFIWKPVGNTNYHIQQKYKAFAEFAARQGRGFTACAVRDRWVNIRSTFNHNLRKVERSKMAAASGADVYVPCWPLWKPLQFLREVPKKVEAQYENLMDLMNSDYEHPKMTTIKEESQSEIEDIIVNIRQRSERTNRPRFKPVKTRLNTGKCVEVLDNLITAMKPLIQKPRQSSSEQSYWFFGKHVTEQLHSMREIDAVCASQEIMKFLEECSTAKSGTFGLT